MGAYANGRVYNAAAWLIAGLVSTLSVALIVMTILGG
jgi:Mn2+/Fe2+ NRAMP family transporter